MLPILQEIGPKVTHVGANGLAVSMKIATNLSLAVQMLAFSEGVLLAEKSGIARETAVEVLLNSVIASPMVKYRGPFVLNMPDEAWFDVNMMQKDMLLALEMGRQLDVPLPTHVRYQSNCSRPRAAWDWRKKILPSFRSAGAHGRGENGSDGVMEWWSDGFRKNPILHYSDTAYSNYSRWCSMAQSKKSKSQAPSTPPRSR